MVFKYFLGQFEVSETVSGSVTFPVFSITSLRILADLFSRVLRGSSYWEIGAKDVVSTYSFLL